MADAPYAKHTVALVLRVTGSSWGRTAFRISAGKFRFKRHVI